VSEEEEAPPSPPRWHLFLGCPKKKEKLIFPPMALKKELAGIVGSGASALGSHVRPQRCDEADEVDGVLVGEDLACHRQVHVVVLGG
jgi:hypothetical protein